MLNCCLYSHSPESPTVIHRLFPAWCLSYLPNYTVGSCLVNIPVTASSEAPREMFKAWGHYVSGEGHMTSWCNPIYFLKEPKRTRFCTCAPKSHSQSLSNMSEWDKEGELTAEPGSGDLIYLTGLRFALINNAPIPLSTGRDESIWRENTI